MKKFIFLYNGPATPMEEMTEEEGAEVMGKWAAWMERVGDALVDVGAPMANGRAVADNGDNVEATALNGYTIVQAEDMDGALALTEGHPFLSDNDGKFSIEVHELMPVPEMK